MNSHAEMEVDCNTVKQKLDNQEEFLFLDCREQNEYDTVNIPGTMLLPMSEMQARVSELEPYQEQEIIVHCHHGGRSLQVAHWLTQQGFANVRSLAGGIDEWAQTIQPGMARY